MKVHLCIRLCKGWTFLVELLNVSKENSKLTYPAIIRSEGIAPSQYGTKSMLGDRFVDVEENTIYKRRKALVPGSMMERAMKGLKTRFRRVMK